jgi:hypothetical protein
MALASSDGASSASRKIRRLGIAVVIVAALYSAGWFFVASKFEDFLKTQLSGRGPVDIECPGLSTSGFPFLIGFTCASTGIADPATGDRLAAGAFRAAARIYSPGAAVVELDGPAHLSLSDGTAITADWKALRSSFSVGISRLKTLSSFGDGLSFDLMNAALYQPILARASHGEFHVRGKDDDLEAAVLVRDLVVNAEGQAPVLPMLSTSLQLLVDGKAGLLEGKPLVSKAMKGQVESFKIEAPGGLFGTLDGPFEIDDEGYLSGTFKTRFEKIGLWEQTLLKIFPDASGTISGMAALLKGLAKGGEDVTVNLVVDKGTITLSMVPIGFIPPF